MDWMSLFAGLRYSRADLLNELIQKPHIPGIELADLADAVLHHCDPFHAHAESKTGDYFGVIGRLLLRREGEHGGIDHSAAQQLDPAGLLALPAAFSAAKDATDLHVGTGLGEREERGEEARLHRRSKQRLHRMVE